jgi:hypothetical protein
MEIEKITALVTSQNLNAVDIMDHILGISWYVAPRFAMKQYPPFDKC